MITLNLRLPDDVHGQLKELAKLDDRSLNSEIVRAARCYISLRNHMALSEKNGEKVDPADFFMSQEL